MATETFLLWDLCTLCEDVFAVIGVIKKPNGQELGRREGKEEEEEPRCRRHGEETGSPR